MQASRKIKRYCNTDDVTCLKCTLNWLNCDRMVSMHLFSTRKGSHLIKKNSKYWINLKPNWVNCKTQTSIHSIYCTLQIGKNKGGTTLPHFKDNNKDVRLGKSNQAGQRRQDSGGWPVLHHQLRQIYRERKHCEETYMKVGEGTEPTHHSRRMATCTRRNDQVKDTGQGWEEE